MAKDKEAKPENDNADEKGEATGPETAEVGDRAKDDYAELREQMLRIAAEFDNYKKRVKKELDSAERTGKATLIKDMLPVIDEFEIAMLAMDGSDEKVAKGIEMLYSNLIDTLKREGLSEIKVDGVFDPYKHEIMMVRESEKKEGTILEVVKKGYMFDNRLLRPAAVIIAKGKEKNDNKKTE